MSAEGAEDAEGSIGAPLDGLGRLGEGGSADRLRFRLVLGILWRCVRLVRPVARHVVALSIGFASLAIVILPIGLLIFDLLWTRVLQGEPLPAGQASLLWLDAALWVDVEELPIELRKQLARTVAAIGLVASAVITPLALGLYYYQVWILQRINQLLRVELLDQLQALSLRFHANNRIGDAIYRLYQDSAMVTQLIEVMILTPIAALGRFVFCLAVVSAYDPSLALILLCIWPPTLLIGAYYSQRMRIGFRAAREANSELTSRIQETVAGIKVIKAYGAETREQERFEWSSRAAFREAFKARNLFATYQVLIFWVLGSVTLTVVSIAALHTRDAAPLALASASFAAWNLGLYNFFKVRAGDGATATRDIYRTWGRIQDVAIGLDRVFEVLDLEPEVQDAPDARELEHVERGVSFRGVSFAYQPERPVLDGIELDASVGTITAVVGPTGSGKSTLMALLLRLFDPSAGRVEIDGEDLRRFTTQSIRSNVSIALQENVLFGDTIRENIRYAVPDASDEAVRAAARVACADEFIEQLPGGYDTLLGERGTKLSTGQRQRLSIARAIVKDTAILVLDEPTASLDAATELDVLRRLAEWGRGRTIFIITHRLSTIRRADRIALLRAGRIEESGSHAELMQRESGAYRSFVEAETVGTSLPDPALVAS